VRALGEKKLFNITLFKSWKKRGKNLLRQKGIQQGELNKELDPEQQDHQIIAPSQRTVVSHP